MKDINQENINNTNVQDVFMRNATLTLLSLTSTEVPLLRLFFIIFLIKN